jgi:hypothetical protein
MEAEIATLIQRLEAFQVALLEAALAAADLEELLADAAEADEAAAEPELPPAWKVDGTNVQTGPGEPWINVYDAIKSVLETCDQLEVPADAESSTTERVRSDTPR